MIRILMKKQLKMLFSGFFVDRKTGKSRSKGAVVLGIISYVAVLQGCMGAMFGMEAYSVCEPLCSAGLDWMYMAMMSMMGASELMRRYSGIQRQQGRCALILTCLDAKVEMYKKMGFEDEGISDSSWGGEQWHQMRKGL